MSMLWTRHKKGVDVESAPSTHIDDVVVAEEKKTYTKSEITLMKTADLKILAESLEIPDASELSGAKLKEILIEKLGL